MKVRVVPPEELSPGALATWEGLVARDDRFGTPFLSPHFALAAGRATRRVHVLVAGEPDQPQAFLAFQVRFGLLGWCGPVGAHLSDYHGLVYAQPPAEPATRWLAAAGIHLYAFDHLHPSQAACGWGGSFDHPSPLVRFGPRFEDYWDTLRDTHRKLVRDTDRCTRLIERDLGPLHLQLHSPRVEDLQRLVDWKRRQYRSTGVADALGPAWTRSLLGELHGADHPTCQGVLSVLRAGDRTVALHFGLRAGNLLHYWFPVYDPELQRYSPGRLLLVQLMREGARQGLTVLDCGKGEDTTKRQFANDTQHVAEGYVCRSTVRGMAAKLVHWAYWRARHTARRMAR